MNMKYLKSLFMGMVLFFTFSGKPLANTLVELDTSLGAIKIELYDDKAPITVANFLKYIDGGYYSSKGMFYRVVRLDNDNGSPKIEVIQGGISVDDAPTPFPPIAHEDTEQTGVLHLDGTISMARGPVGSASDAFFITIGAQPSLDKGGMRNPDGAGFAAFGRVVAGMDVVKNILNIRDAKEDVDDYVVGQMLREPVKISSAKRLPEPAEK